MNIIKSLRKPYLAAFLAIITLFYSCNGDDLVQGNSIDQTSENFTFDFSFFETHNQGLIAMDAFDFDQKSTLSRLETNNLILDEINGQLGTDLDYSDDFKQLELTSYEEVENYIYTNNLLDETDMSILANFHLNLNTLEIADALSILEEDVNIANLSTVKMEKFEYLANVVQLIETETPGFFTATVGQRSCAGALLGLAFASAGLVAACNPPAAGATVGVGCYLAAANFVRASATVGIECGDDEEQE